MVSVGLKGVTKLFRTWNEVMVNHIGAEIFSCSSRLPLAHDLIFLSEEKGIECIRGVVSLTEIQKR
jgi:hypothetical protein